MNDFFDTEGFEADELNILFFEEKKKDDAGDWNNFSFTNQWIRWSKNPQSGSSIENNQKKKMIQELEDISV